MDNSVRGEFLSGGGFCVSLDLGVSLLSLDREPFLLSVDWPQAAMHSNAALAMKRTGVALQDRWGASRCIRLRAKVPEEVTKTERRERSMMPIPSRLRLASSRARPPRWPLAQPVVLRLQLIAPARSAQPLAPPRSAQRQSAESVRTGDALLCDDDREQSRRHSLSSHTNSSDPTRQTGHGPAPAQTAGLAVFFSRTHPRVLSPIQGEFQCGVPLFVCGCCAIAVAGCSPSGPSNGADTTASPRHRRQRRRRRRPE